MRTPGTTLTRAMAALLLPAALAAQTPAHDPSSTLESVLPPDVAQQVLARIADARSRGLPAAALEHRALELQAKGMKPADIPGAVGESEAAMAKGKDALIAGGRAQPSDAEVEAAGTGLGRGVDGAAVSALARSAPSGRSLAVPLSVMTSLVDRGLPSDEALAQVRDRLQANASDDELAGLPEQAARGQAHRSDAASLPPAASRPPDRAGPPASIPANGASGSRPTAPGSSRGHPTGRP
jgi:hypothetical protein